jgi:GT2 family glycosyltransferase
VFERLGGFDDKPFCEDIDFSWRAQLNDIRPVFLPEAVVHYRQRLSLLQMFRQHRRFGTAQALLYRDFHASGMPRRPASEVVHDWLASLKTLAVLLRSTPDERLRWVRRLARSVGRLLGSARYRVFYP